MSKNARFLILIPFVFTILLLWFAWSNYHFAPIIAKENLRGTALSIANSIEQLAAADDSQKALSLYNSTDIAYFSLIDDSSIIRFHTNRSLIGAKGVLPDSVSFKNDSIIEGREILGTGEEIYYLKTEIHNGGSRYILNLALHPFRADSVIRRAKTGVTLVSLLTIALWMVTFVAWKSLKKEEERKKEMMRREELARLGEMSAVLAHEIRNPLAGIKGFAQLMESAKTIEQASLYADRIVTQSVRMENLVNDLLSFSRADSGERQKTDLATLVFDCVTMIRMEIDPERIALEYLRSEPTAAFLVADRIIQLLLNLMKNGIQSMPDGGTLKVDLKRFKESAIITISDTGTGIPKEDIGKIFEPFWTSKAKGTGLGLALCKKIAEEHKGELLVESVVGVGTTFKFVLPLAE